MREPAGSCSGAEAARGGVGGWVVSSWACVARTHSARPNPTVHEAEAPREMDGIVGTRSQAQ